jgi:hypothetical protein
MKDHRAIVEMTRLTGEVRDEFADPDHGTDHSKIMILTAIHDTLTWVMNRSVPNTRITNYFPDSDD